MLKKIFLFLVFVFSIGTGLFAQSYADKTQYLVDSLDLNQLDSINKNILVTFIESYHKTNGNDEKLKLFSEFLDATTNNVLGKRYNDAFKPLIEKLSDDNKQLKNLYLGQYYKNLAYLSQSTSSNDQYILYLDSAQYHYKLSGNQEGIAKIPVYKALHFGMLGDYQKALDFCYEGLGILESAGIKAGQVEAYYVLGGINNALNENRKSIEAHKKAIAIAKELKQFKFIGMNYNSIGRIYVEEEKLDSAKMMLELAISNLKKVGEKNSLSYSQYILATVKSKQGDNQGAIKDLKEGLVYLEEIGDYTGIITNKIFLGEIYTEEAQYNLGLQEVHDAQKLAKELESTEYLEGTSRVLTNLYEGSGQLDSALYYAKKNTIYRQELFTDENKKRNMEMEVQYQFEKQKEIDDLKHAQNLALSESENQQTRIILLTVGILAILIAIFSILLFNRLRFIRKQKVELDLAYEKLETSKKNELAVSNLKALQSQMNPHFIFNALNAVQDLVLLKDVRNSNKYLGRFSDLIRKILLSSKHQFISLQEEIEILGLYLDLEKLRFEDDFNVHFSCDISESKQDSIQLPAMFIQPYIENAIKHGLFSKKGEKNLTVAFSMQDENTLKCLVEDDGVGQKAAAELKETRLHLHTGFSTEAINQRILLLNQTLDKKIELEVEDLFENNMPAGTRIVLLFPV